MDKEIGKIKSIRYGKGGYQDAMFGLSVTLTGRGWGVGDFWGFWDTDRSDSTEWTEDDRIRRHGEVAMRISKLLKEARVATVEELTNIPVEATFDSPYQKLVSWRILTEVL